jgi:3-hydroxymyristoyl/3-hydroxydecanoyl-(acyl carrier protein) dehydratase
LNPTNGHFRAFSFVDRITSVQPGGSIRGLYHIPAGLAEFPIALVAEAVGQLAAWSAMAALDFKVRPVTGLAGTVKLFIPSVPAGSTLELVADIETAEMDAVGYSGTASVDGQIILQMSDCVGPMMPLDEFDDPEAMREHFAVLQRAGAVPDGFGGVPDIAVHRTGGEAGKTVSARFDVPASGSFYADHFPRRPVFPGTLLMNLHVQPAITLAAEIPAPDGCWWRLSAVSHMKLRDFIQPGENLTLLARIHSRTEDALALVVEANRGEKLLSSTRMHFVAEAVS